MEISGGKYLDVELLPDATVRVSIGLKTRYEAAVAYDAIKEQARTGRLVLVFSTGEVLEEDGQKPTGAAN